MTIQCDVCGADLEPTPTHACQNCTAPPRVRSLVRAVQDVLDPDDLEVLRGDGSVLAFAMDRTEEQVLSPLGATFTSVSLFGTYRPGHIVGVDARDLSRFPDGEFCGAYSCCLFDYFLEHQQALNEAYRVIRSGGVFLTHIANFRVNETDNPPETIRVLEPAPGFYDYVPAGSHLLSVRVGAQWFMDAMRQAGFVDVGRAEYTDASSGVKCDWFYGRRRD